MLANTPVVPRRLLLNIAIAAALLSITATAVQAQATQVDAGQTLTVTPGSPFEGNSFLVRGTLNVDGATVSSVGTDRGVTNLNGATVLDGVGFTNSSGSIVNSTITSSAFGIGTGSNRPLGSLPRSSVTVVGSSITGNGSTGVNISGGGFIRFDRSTVNGIASGMHLLAGATEIVNGSIVTGQQVGFRTRASMSAQPVELDPADWVVVLDDSSIIGVQGSAILVTGFNTPQVARFIVRNNAVLQGGNGVILQAETTGVVDFTASNTVLDGNILIADTATAALTFTDNAILNGTITGPADTTVTNGATWNLTGNSSIGDLTLGATGTVKLGNGTAFNTLNVNGDFVGQGGTFVFNTVFGDDSSASDKVVIAGNTSGTGNIVVNNINGAGAQTGEGIQLISVAGTSGAGFVMPGRATAGIYEYLLYKGGVANPNDGAWYLRSTYTGDPCDLNPSLPICAPTDPGTPVDPTDPVAPVIPVDPIDPGTPVDPIPLLRPEPGAYLANQAASVRMFQLRRHDRGEPAFDRDRIGAWARVSRDQIHTTVAGQVDTRSHTSVLQVGSDVARWGQAGRGSVGVMLATGEANTDAVSRITGYGTKGKVRGDAIGLYGTWVQSAEDSAGLYVDGWLQYGRYDSEVRGDALARETYDATTRAASLEAGYAWAFGASDRGTWYLQPQAQLTYTDYKGDTLQEANGTVVEDDRAGGLESRVGVRLFGNDNGTGNRVQPFLAVNWLYTDRGDAMRFDGERLDARLPTNRYEAQAGAQLRLGERWSAWGDMRVQRGDSGYKDVAGQIGLRRAW